MSVWCRDDGTEVTEDVDGLIVDTAIEPDDDTP